MSLCPARHLLRRAGAAASAVVPVVILAVALAAGWSGCHRSAPPPGGDSAPAGSAFPEGSAGPEDSVASEGSVAPGGSAALGQEAVAPAGGAPAADVTLQVGGAEALREAIERRRGQVVLVDFWATWCVPCVKQFPHTVELSRRHAAEGLAVVSVSLDEPGQRDRVLGFLEKQGARFENLLSRHGLGSDAIEEFGLRGDVPLYRLHDRSGALRYQFSAEPEGLERGEPIERMDDRVRELLEEK